MEKTITIDGKKVRFKSTGGTARRYRNQFNRDFFADLLQLYPIMQLKKEGFDTNNLDLEIIKKLSFEVFENITWTLAKTADKSIPEPEEWLEQFDELPIFDILPKIQDLMMSSLQSAKQRAQDTKKK